MKKLYLILCISILYSCSSDNKDQKYSDGLTSYFYVVDLDKATKQDTIKLSSYFRNVKTILLETNKESLFGHIDGVQIWKDKIFILDKQYIKGVLVFNKDGRFIRRIGSIGQAPGEYIATSDFTIDENKEEIYLMDPESRRINKYKIETGEYINAIGIKEKGISIQHIQYEDGKLFGDAFYDKETDKRYMLREIDLQTGLSLEKYLNVSIYNCDYNAFTFKNESFFYCRNQGSPKYTQFFMDTVMTIDKGKIRPYLVIKSKEWVTKDIIKKVRENNSDFLESPYFFEHSIAHDVSNLMEFGDFIYFKYYKKGIPTYVLYNKKTGETQCTNFLINDLLYSINFRLQNIGCSYENKIYGYVDNQQIPMFLDGIPYLVPDLDKIDKIRTLTPDSNPIIFYYECKK